MARTNKNGSRPVTRVPGERRPTILDAKPSKTDRASRSMASFRRTDSRRHYQSRASLISETPSEHSQSSSSAYSPVSSDRASSPESTELTHSSRSNSPGTDSNASSDHSSSTIARSLSSSEEGSIAISSLGSSTTAFSIDSFEADMDAITIKVPVTPNGEKDGELTIPLGRYAKQFLETFPAHLFADPMELSSMTKEERKALSQELRTAMENLKKDFSGTSSKDTPEDIDRKMDIDQIIQHIMPGKEIAASISQEGEEQTKQSLKKAKIEKESKKLEILKPYFRKLVARRIRNHQQHMRVCYALGLTVDKCGLYTSPKDVSSDGARRRIFDDTKFPLGREAQFFIQHGMDIYFHETPICNRSLLVLGKHIAKMNNDIEPRFAYECLRYVIEGKEHLSDSESNSDSEAESDISCELTHLSDEERSFMSSFYVGYRFGALCRLATKVVRECGPLGTETMYTINHLLANQLNPNVEKSDASLQVQTIEKMIELNTGKTSAWQKGFAALLKAAQNPEPLTAVLECLLDKSTYAARFAALYGLDFRKMPSEHAYQIEFISDFTAFLQAVNESDVDKFQDALGIEHGSYEEPVAELEQQGLGKLLHQLHSDDTALSSQTLDKSDKQNDDKVVFASKLARAATLYDLAVGDIAVQYFLRTNREGKALLAVIDNNIAGARYVSPEMKSMLIEGLINHLQTLDTAAPKLIQLMSDNEDLSLNEIGNKKVFLLDSIRKPILSTLNAYSYLFQDLLSIYGLSTTILTGGTIPKESYSDYKHMLEEIEHAVKYHMHVGEDQFFELLVKRETTLLENSQRLHTANETAINLYLLASSHPTSVRTYLQTQGFDTSNQPNPNENDYSRCHNCWTDALNELIAEAKYKAAATFILNDATDLYKSASKMDKRRYDDDTRALIMDVLTDADTKLDKKPMLDQRYAPLIEAHGQTLQLGIKGNETRQIVRRLADQYNHEHNLGIKKVQDTARLVAREQRAKSIAEKAVLRGGISSTELTTRLRSQSSNDPMLRRSMTMYGLDDKAYSLEFLKLVKGVSAEESFAELHEQITSEIETKSIAPVGSKFLRLFELAEKLENLPVALANAQTLRDDLLKLTIKHTADEGEKKDLRAVSQAILEAWATKAAPKVFDKHDKLDQLASLRLTLEQLEAIYNKNDREVALATREVYQNVLLQFVDKASQQGREQVAINAIEACKEKDVISEKLKHGVGATSARKTLDKAQSKLSKALKKAARADRADSASNPGSPRSLSFRS